MNYFKSLQRGRWAMSFLILIFLVSANTSLGQKSDTSATKHLAVTNQKDSVKSKLKWELESRCVIFDILKQ